MMKNIQKFALYLMVTFLFSLLSFARETNQEPKNLASPRFILQDNTESKIQTKGSITSVIIYPDRATIVREAELNLSPGLQQIVFSGLPSTLIPNSLRASGEGDVAVKILGLEVASEYLESALLPEIKKLQAEIDGLHMEITKTKNVIEVLDSQEKFLISIQSATSTKASEQIVLGKPDIQSWEKVFEFLGSKLQSVKQAKLDQQKILKEQETKLDVLKKKLDSMKPQRSQEARKVTVLLESSQAGRFKLSLAYTVTNARWIPLYTLRALPDSSEIEFTLTGLIQQRSGENWENIKAQLSTSSPTLETKPSELNPWILDIYVPKPAMREKKVEGRVEGGVLGGVVGGVLGGVVGEVEASAAPPKEAVLDTAAILEAGIHINFEVKRKVDIPSDGAPHKVPIDSQKMKVKFDYMAVPKVKEITFLRASLRNTLPYPMLPGHADLFIIQDFVGTTELPHIAANEEAKMYFGEDRQIKLTYEQVKREKSGGGFLGKTEKLRLVYRITVQNFRKSTAEVEVHDQLPVSQNSKVEVKDVNISLPPTKKDEKGILTWTLSLSSQEKKEILIDFTIEYPKEATIIGL